MKKLLIGSVLFVASCTAMPEQSVHEELPPEEPAAMLRWYGIEPLDGHTDSRGTFSFTFPGGKCTGKLNPAYAQALRVYNSSGVEIAVWGGVGPWVKTDAATRHCMPTTPSSSPTNTTATSMEAK